MIDREHDLPITKQAEILKVSRGSVYYLRRPVSAANLAIMQRLDRLHLEFPFAGSRMLRGLLASQGCKIGRRHVKTLMRWMGIEALYRRPRTTKPEPGHKIYPYLLRGMEITRPNQVWAMDISYIPMARGFVYLAERPSSTCLSRQFNTAGRGPAAFHRSPSMRSTFRLRSHHNCSATTYLSASASSSASG
jgi:putative transposase